MPRALSNYDVVLAMYHDQGLPVLKHAGFGHAVNVTLGLPIIRTSVDHGTALDLAGTGRADAGSLIAATRLAVSSKFAALRRSGASRFAPVIFARKRFGQHFLHDRSVLDRIVREIAPKPEQALLEIGPGRGALTERLIGQSRTLDAIEIDRDLAAQLRARWGAPQAFELHVADALDFDLRRTGAHARQPPARDRQSALQHFDAAAVSHRRRP